jgi:hypothetical protein
VPIRTFTTATISEQATVSLSVETACGDEIAFQNPSQPFSVDLIATAPSGMRTMMLR